MGITFESIRRMEALGLFGAVGAAILDIGSSNLYSAGADEIASFLAKYRRDAATDTGFIKRLSEGSGYDPVRGGLNESFVGELFEKAGMEYLSFDIADGYRTRILDLNHASLPPELRNHFDLVLNFGTTEHILNQYNSFKVIHDATRVGGCIFHSLPAVGHVDHGYITYTCRCFFDVAGYNEYEVVDFWLDGPNGNNDILQGPRSYSTYFPAVQKRIDELLATAQGIALRDTRIPDIGLNIVLRKVKDKPFWGALESSTSVGKIPGGVTDGYSGVSGHIGKSSHAEAVPVVSDRNGMVDNARLALRSFPTLHRVARRIYRGFRPLAPQLDAHPELGLTGLAQQLRDRFIRGQASLNESLKLYELVTAAGANFPLDWEDKILRDAIAQNPDRMDLISRLQIVSAMRGRGGIETVDADPKGAQDGDAETASLRALIKSFGTRALAGLTDPAAISDAFGGAAQDALLILGNSVFARLPISEQILAITTIYNTTMSVVLRESIEIADSIAAHFSRLLGEPGLTRPQALRLYDCLYGLYFAGAQSVSEMRRFDSACVQPFDAYLRGADAASARRRQAATGEPANICYLCHCAHFDKGNAVSPIMASIAKAHAARPGRRVYLYCVQWVAQEFVDSFAGSGVIVRQFKQDWNYDKLDTIALQFEADRIDVAITDLNSAIASWLFSRRVAAIQTWIVMAFPYWSLADLDWALLPVLDYQPDFGIAPDRYSALGIKQETVTLIQDCAAADVAAARATLPADAFIFGVFSRLIKLTPAYFETVARILSEEPRAHVLIVGTGDPRPVHEFISQAGLKERVTFVHGNVDLNVYGRIIDVMLDNFPFHGANACREVAIHGKPVLSLRTPEWGKLLREERDPELVVADFDGYVRLAVRLARDKEYYAARSVDSARVAAAVTRTADMAAEVEGGIEQSRQHIAHAADAHRAKVPRSSLDQLIVRNVEGKHTGSPFYPGQPDPVAQQFPRSASGLYGTESATVIANAESLLLGYFLNLYRQSGNTAARRFDVDPGVRRKLTAIYDANKTIASPLFLVTRYLIAEMYSKVQVEDPALELGMGAGDTAKAIFGERTLAVGSTPVIDEIMGARHHFGNHRRYMAIDAAHIPFADSTFNSIVMNYTFYHLEDPVRTCQEILRVLAPGGRLYFNFAIRDRIEATRLWPKVLTELGLEDYARMAGGFVFTDYGSADETPTKSGCLALLERSGFTEIAVTDYMSADLSRLIWLARDFEILFQLNLQQGTARPALEREYREFYETELAALLTHDAARCETNGGGTFMFVAARKPGGAPVAFTDEEINQRIVCPVACAPLQRRDGFFWSEQARKAYPVYHDIALMMPVYADIWREQNAPGGDEPDRWKPFSY